MPESKRSEGDLARRLIRSQDRAALSTRLAEDGWPYGSLVMTACGHDGAPLLLLSDLAEHSKNAMADQRVSLLFDGTAGLDSPLTGARVTVLGTLAKSEDPGLRARYLARHPDAEGFIGFADFHLYRLEIVRAHLVAGFGAIHWIGRQDLVWDPEARGAAALADQEAEIVSHMNDDHADAIALYAGVLLGLGGDGWTMTGLDPEGIDLRSGGRIARLEFDVPVCDAGAARAALVDMVKNARKKAETG
jgi:putative heme iron utilization protein